jgi:hypothetical protein
MNAREIIKKYLEENGYDGLYNLEGECGCIKDDLFPCESCPAECEAGYLIDPPEAYKNDDVNWIGPKERKES